MAGDKPEDSVKSSDLFNLELKTLQKKYGGSIKNETWSLKPRLLGLSPIEISVFRGEGDNYPLVSVGWEGLLLIMNRELHIEPMTSSTKLRWFMKYLEVFDPELRDISPHIFEEAAAHEKRGTT